MAQILEEKSIKYFRQVSINNDGIIVGLRSMNNCHVIDFVIEDGEPVSVGKSIRLYKVLSCKTTCRERWSQDNWSLVHKPKLFLLLTLSNDYPSSERFKESRDRKIITASPKKRDDRTYKLNFDDLPRCLAVLKVSLNIKNFFKT